jgi:hypothetical protein
MGAATTAVAMGVLHESVETELCRDSGAKKRWSRNMGGWQKTISKFKKKTEKCRKMATLSS